MTDKPDKPVDKQFRNVRSYDAVDTNSLPDFRRILNDIASRDDVDPSTITFLTVVPNGVRIIFQRVRKVPVE